METILYTRTCYYCTKTFQSELKKARACEPCKTKNRDKYRAIRAEDSRCTREDTRHSKNKPGKGSKRDQLKAKRIKDEAAEAALAASALSHLVRWAGPVGQSGPVKHFRPGDKGFRKLAEIYLR